MVARSNLLKEAKSKEEGIRKKEEGRRKKEEGRRRKKENLYSKLLIYFCLTFD
ncbi:hypothetical protein QUB60_20310 [Microcoleus sp. A2-C5]|uniref:hypothetical protein n=1 Tax=Microcoleaceae TaxID=1892252 RepID=UPI00223793F4|nr:hypothetical protein [Lyngbya sp. CCAP 1446/10]MCW6050710.1 hypothetical protein [Lyngbya sp. CCAP 1446/10]